MQRDTVETNKSLMDGDGIDLDMVIAEYEELEKVNFCSVHSHTNRFRNESVFKKLT